MEILETTSRAAEVLPLTLMFILFTAVVLILVILMIVMCVYLLLLRRYFLSFTLPYADSFKNKDYLMMSVGRITQVVEGTFVKLRGGFVFVIVVLEWLIRLWMVPKTGGFTETAAEDEQY